MSVETNQLPTRASTASEGQPAPEKPPAVPPLATIVIEPHRGWRGIDVAELYRFRDLLYFLSLRDIKVRYKQTVLGAAWAVIQPVLTMVVFSEFFGKLGGLDQKVSDPYPIFVYSGLLPWTFFAGVVTQCSQSLISSSNLISKIYFPRLIVPFASAGAGLVDFAISCLVMLTLMLAYGIGFSMHLLLLPLLTVIVLVAALGVGSLLAALVVSYRDFRYVVPFAIQIWMYASPIAYPLEVVDVQWRPLYALNPMVGLISGFRSALLGQNVEVSVLLVSSIVSIACFVAGCAYFRRMERRFADIV